MIGRASRRLEDFSDASTRPGKLARVVRGAGTLMLYSSLSHFFFRHAGGWWDWIAGAVFGAGAIVSALFVADAGLALAYGTGSASPGQSHKRRAKTMAVLLVLGGLAGFLVTAKIGSGA